MRPIAGVLLGAFLSGCGLLDQKDGSPSDRPARQFAPPNLPLNLPSPDAATPTPGATPVPGAYPRPCDAIFDQELLPTFSLEFAPDELQALKDERAERITNRHPATFRYEGEVHPVTVMNKGQSDCGEKLALIIDFNDFDHDARFRGLRRLNLDHGNCHPLRERVALHYARDVGLYAPCANNARLEINGEYYGLYVNIENVDKEFLERNFDDDEGNLYKTKNKKTHEDDPDTSDWDELRVATLEELEALMDLNQAIRFFALEGVIPAKDNYFCCDRNFFIYHHPSDGWFYISWDYDYVLPAAGEEDYPLLPARHPYTALVLDDPEWLQRFKEAVAEMNAHYDPDLFDARYDRWWVQIRDAAIEDPFLVDLKDLPADADPFANVKQRIRNRAAFLDEWVASERLAE